MASFGKKRNNILDQPARREIYELIRNNQGLHFRSICRNLNKKMGVVQYHVAVLEKHELIRSVRDGRYKCFFSTEGEIKQDFEISTDIKEKKNLREILITTLRRKTPQKLLKHLAAEGKASHQKLSTIAEVSPQAITFHIKKLFKIGIIEAEKRGRNKFYTLSDDAQNIMTSLF